MNKHAPHRLTMELALRRALKAGQFIVHYHPLIEVATRRIVSLEALLRWEHPRFGLVSPAKFIHVAEDSGLIVRIGELVLRTVCEQSVQWQRDGVPMVPVTINWSSIDPSFVAHVDDNPAGEAIVRAILAMAERLGLRVVAEGVETAAQLDVLHRHGCQVAQGFFFDRPLPADQCRTLLEELAVRPSFTETLRIRVRQGSLLIEPRRATGV